MTAKINLLPSEFRRIRKSETTGKPLIIKTIVLSLIAVIIYISSLFILNYFETKTTLANIQKQIENYQPIMSKYNGIKQKQEELTKSQLFLQQIEDKRVIWSRLLKDIMAGSGKGVILNNIYTDEQNSIVIEGTSSAPASVGNFYLNLKKSPELDSITLQFTEESSQTPFVTFIIKGNIKKGGAFNAQNSE